MNEIWLDVKGYEGFYQISSLGRIKSVDRFVPIKFKNGNVILRFYSSKFLKPFHDKDGYIIYDLIKDKKRTHFRFHRLLAEHFIPNPDNKPEVNHINGVKYDNRLENLEWCTKSDNMRHLYDALGFKGSNYGKQLTNEHKENIAKHHRKKVLCVELNREFNSNKEAVEWLGLGNTAVTDAIRRNHKSGGYHWKYLTFLNICEKIPYMV